MKPDLVTVDFSGVYEAEGFLSALREKGVPFRLVSLADIEGTNCYCDPEAEQRIRRRLAPVKDAAVRWLDSGDYHYVSGILAGFQEEPFTLVLVDNHPDDQSPAFGEMLSCGGWVSRLSEGNPLLEEVWTLGPDHRLRNRSGTVDRPLEEEIDDLLDAVGSGRIYLSVDKDVLCREAARTDWSQGTYTLARLKGWLGLLLQRNVVAVDLCGECTPSKGATPEDLRINLETNLDLQEFILGYLKK